jgi:hypothetical protein
MTRLWALAWSDGGVMTSILTTSAPSFLAWRRRSASAAMAASTMSTVVARASTRPTK